MFRVQVGIIFTTDVGFRNLIEFKTRFVGSQEDAQEVFDELDAILYCNCFLRMLDDKGKLVIDNYVELNCEELEEEEEAPSYHRQAV